jgi:acetylornithine/succinyldiaminopimelate/putrescine aminotransferase
LLIVDEVQCGLGRTGKLFAYQHSDVKPDILTVAKPLGLGVPLGAIVFNEKAADGFKPGDHGSTFGGGPLACRLSLEFMHELNEGNLMARVNETGAYFKQQLQQLQESHPDIIKDVRAIGLMVGAELTFPGKNVPGKMLARGFVMNCTNETTLRFLPPYIIRNDEIDAMLTTLEEVIVEEAKEI